MVADVGSGEPVLFLHSYGPGTTAWITFYKTIGAFARHFRCILMDLPNFSKTGPIVYREGVHAVQARTAVALMDRLGIERLDLFLMHWPVPMMTVTVRFAYLVLRVTDASNQPANIYRLMKHFSETEATWTLARVIQPSSQLMWQGAGREGNAGSGVRQPRSADVRSVG